MLSADHAKFANRFFFLYSAVSRHRRVRRRFWRAAVSAAALPNGRGCVKSLAALDAIEAAAAWDSRAPVHGRGEGERFV